MFKLGSSGSLDHSISLASQRFLLVSIACCSQPEATMRLLEGQEDMCVMLIGDYGGNAGEMYPQRLPFYTMVVL